ncbi:MAG: hypothetical protein V7752_15515 [Halopseudomonas sp.]
MNMPATIEVNNLALCEPLPPASYSCQAVELSRLSSSVMCVQLVVPQEFPRHQAGQYIELVLADGSSRPYSIAGYTPEIRYLELHIELRQDSQTGHSIIQQLRHQGEIAVKPAQGSVQLKSAAGAQVFLAAGTGFAQIKALMEQHLSDLKAQPNKQPTYLFWGTDHAEQRYLESLVESWCSDCADLHYRPLDWQAGDSWEAAVSAELEQLEHCQVYACGSPQRVFQTLDALEQAGLPSANLQSDIFAYAPRP